MLLMFVVSCGGGAATPAPTPTLITPPAPAATPTPPPPVNRIDQELLGAAGVTASCDHPAEAQLTCENEASATPQFHVTINAATYARWSIHFADLSTPLTGDETLYVAAEQAGNLSPNLYLVERSGQRVPVALARYGLTEGAHDLFIPLREIKTDEDVTPNFAEVVEVQIVFEWADMSGVLTLHHLQFRSVWQEAVAPAARAQSLAAALTVPAGFAVTAVADQVREMTQFDFDQDGALWVSQQNGRIWRYTDTNHDGVYDQRLLYGAGFGEVVGLLTDPVDGAVWIGGRGRLLQTLDSDGNGVVDTRTVRLDGLPWGRHQNNGMVWNPDPDPFTGEPAHHWIYFGLGSIDDLEVGGPWNAAVLRFPRDGQGEDDLQIVSQGNRNPYMLVWAPVPVDLTQPDGPFAWQLFAGENGPDFNDAPDEINHIRWQHHYGFPEQFGPVAADAVDGEPYSGPVYAVAAHASASGLAYISNPAWPPAYRTLYVSLFGQVFSQESVGHTVERVTLTTVEEKTGVTYRGEPTTFVAGLDRPLPMLATPGGDLLVGDYATGVIYAVKYVGE